jgi:hypothetical protein
MTIDERLENIAHKLEFVATLQQTNEGDIAKLIEKVDVLTDRTIQAMDAINRLSRIADHRPC